MNAGRRCFQAPTARITGMDENPYETPTGLSSDETKRAPDEALGFGLTGIVTIWALVFAVAWTAARIILWSR